MGVACNFMTLLNTNKKSLTLRFDKSKDEIKNLLLKLTRNSFVTDDIIQINFKPSFFDAFAVRGLLTFNLKSYDNNKTEIICQIIPTTLHQDRLYFFLFLLLLWTVVAFVLSFSFNTLIVVTIGWIILLLILRLSVILNRGKLEAQARFILEQLK